MQTCLISGFYAKGDLDAFNAGPGKDGDWRRVVVSRIHPLRLKRAS
jgi:hypothetical protein